jgi:hypothetical protein
MTNLAGIFFSEGTLTSGWFQVIAAFVAINTLVYAALSLGKLLPRRRE